MNSFKSLMEKYKFEPNNDTIKFEFIANLKRKYNLSTKDYSILCNKFFNGDITNKSELENYAKEHGNTCSTKKDDEQR